MAHRQTIVAKSILTLTAGAVATIAIGATLAHRPAALVSSHPTTQFVETPVVQVALAAPALAKTSPVAAKPPAEPLVVRRVLDLGGPIAFGDYAWDDKGVPAGPLIITVDLAAQTLSVFRDGYEIGATAILYGADEKPTPLGTFPITAKDAHHVSRTYGNAPMPYTLRLTADGVSIHGTEVAWGYATHGCVGVPTAFAKKLFAVAGIGDRVIITRGKSLAMGQAIAT